MNRPLSRRNFLRAAAAAPVVAQSGALQALTAKITETTALAQAGLTVGADMPMAWGIGIFGNKSLYAAYKMGMLPDWAKASIHEQIDQNSMGRLTPDVAALRSVSLSAKLRMQRDRTSRRLWTSIDDFHINELARQTFWNSQNIDGPKAPR